jgi:hypothetical protein
MALLRRLFERIPSQAIFWALFAWTVWKLFFLCARLYLMDMYFYASLAVASRSPLTLGRLTYDH